jgi:tagatose 1,6-diphosphate aldolase GatY/KbaY
MRARFSELLKEASARGGAAGAFTCYNLETAGGVLAAAEERRRGVILLISRQSMAAPSGELLLAGLVAAADHAGVPACVQLDHVSDLSLIRRALELGAGAAMADGSKLSFEENVRFVRAAASGGEVEAELGGIAGDEDVATAVATGALTDPDEAADFVAQTGAACLAVSIGNVHGAYREPPALDWARLEEVRERVDIAISLHGASGLPDDDVRRAVSLGVAKVNVNTELRERYLAVTEERLPVVREGARLLDLNRAQADAVAEVVTAKLNVLG